MGETTNLDLIVLSNGKKLQREKLLSILGNIQTSLERFNRLSDEKQRSQFIKIRGQNLEKRLQFVRSELHPIFEQLDEEDKLFYRFKVVYQGLKDMKDRWREEKKDILIKGTRLFEELDIYYRQFPKLSLSRNEFLTLSSTFFIGAGTLVGSGLYSIITKPDDTNIPMALFGVAIGSVFASVPFAARWYNRNIDKLHVRRKLSYFHKIVDKGVLKVNKFENRLHSRLSNNAIYRIYNTSPIPESIEWVKRNKVYRILYKYTH